MILMGRVGHSAADAAETIETATKASVASERVVIGIPNTQRVFSLSPLATRAFTPSSTGYREG
jgi:hypothetical protein